jgi:hypothetical protein
MTAEQFEALKAYIFACVSYAQVTAAYPYDESRMRARRATFLEQEQIARDVLVTVQQP